MALDPEWRDPDLLAALAPSATDVIVLDGEKVTTSLRALTR
jgi:hypothetical protein